jgi:hypothetical protein
MLRLFNSIAAMLAIVACTTREGRVSTDLLQQPAPYLGQVVTVCGFMIGTSNIAERRDGSRSGVGAGLSVRHRELGPALVQLLRQGRENLCLQGRIFRTGCELDPEIICMEWAYEFGIEVDRVFDVTEGVVQ